MTSTERLQQELQDKKIAAQGKAAQERDTNIIAEEYSSEQEMPKEYTVITDGKNLPSELIHCRQVFGYFSNYKEYTHTTASLVGTLMVASAISAGRVRTFTGAFPTLYMAYIAPTASAKDPVIKGLERVDFAVNSEDRTVRNASGLQSSGALDSMLRDCTGQMIIIFDEFGDFLGDVVEGKGSARGTLKAPLKTIYSTNYGDTYHGNQYSDQGGKIKLDPVSIKNLAFGILGITTKNQLLNKIHTDHLSDGTINRYIFVDGTGHKAANSGTYGEANIPVQLMTHLDSFEMIDEDTEMMRLDEDSLLYWKFNISDIAAESGQIWEWCKGDDTKIELASRVRENSLRLATSLAFFEGFGTIPKWLIEWSFNFTLMSVQNFYRLFYYHDPKGDEHLKMIEKVMGWFRKHSGKSISKTTIAQNCTHLRKLKSDERKKVLSELLERGLVSTNSDGTLSYVVPHKKTSAKKC